MVEADKPERQVLKMTLDQIKREIHLRYEGHRRSKEMAENVRRNVQSQAAQDAHGNIVALHTELMKAYNDILKMLQNIDPEGQGEGDRSATVKKQGNPG